MVIEWNVHSFGLAGGTGIGVLKEMHTVTDKNGYFYFPAGALFIQAILFINILT